MDILQRLLNHLFSSRKSKNKNIELEFGDKYLLNSDNYYYCIQMRRDIKFRENVVVELTARSFTKDGVCFGKLIDIDRWDFVSENEISFLEDDVIEQYEMNVIPLLYMDFVFDEKKL